MSNLSVSIKSVCIIKSQIISQNVSLVSSLYHLLPTVAEVGLRDSQLNIFENEGTTPQIVIEIGQPIARPVEVTLNAGG